MAKTITRNGKIYVMAYTGKYVGLYVDKETGLPAPKIDINLTKEEKDKLKKKTKEEYERATRK